MAEPQDFPSIASVLTNDPIFIFGAPRSGVRLLAAALDQHPLLASGPELPFIVTAAQQWRLINDNLGAHHARHHNLSPASTRESFHSALMRLFEQRLSAARKVRMVLHSFAGMLMIGDFAALFPQAHFVVMVRDPRDVASSLMACDWRNPRDGLPLPYTREPEAAARLWNDFLGVAAPTLASLIEADRAVVLRYEDLCRQPERTMGRLAALCRFPADRLIIAADSARLVTMSQDNPHPPLRTGELDVQSIGRWRSQLSASGSAVVESATRTVRLRFGYQ